MTECEIDSDTCKTCYGFNCNSRKEFQKCLKCHSKDDIECSGNITLTNTSVICKNLFESCVTAIDSKGYTRRGCSYRSGFDYKIYSTCESTDCNRDIFPSNRLQCYRCNGEDECNFTPGNSTNSLIPMPCGLMSENDECYTYSDEGNFCFVHHF